MPFASRFLWRTLALTCCALLPLLAHAQLFGDWHEDTAPPPPPLQTKGLISFDANKASQLHYGMDPESIQIGKDGVVRYVVVARSDSGAINAMYEGIRCYTGQLKTYARSGEDGQWRLLDNPQWQDLSAPYVPRYAMALAKQAVCEGSGATSTVANIIAQLKGQDLHQSYR